MKKIPLLFITILVFGINAPLSYSAVSPAISAPPTISEIFEQEGKKTDAVFRIALTPERKRLLRDLKNKGAGKSIIAVTPERKRLLRELRKKRTGQDRLRNSKRIINDTQLRNTRGARSSRLRSAERRITRIQPPRIKRGRLRQPARLRTRLRQANRLR